jgi:basic membrane lipoprotein Med (substrate-binding protein (PBP1-ABC) superfamily)
MQALRKLAALSIVGAALMTSAAAAETKIGYIYVGPAADYGYNMSMDLGRQAVEKQVPGVVTTAFEGVPETGWRMV